LCHPDKVDEVYKQEAHEVFAALNAAYRKNDIKSVESILKKIEIGLFDIHVHRGNRDRAQLEERIGELRREIELITRELVTLSKNENYRQATTLSDLDEYFEQQKIRLEEEIKKLRTELYEEILF
jgi:DnaJ-domain-containing protein 1